MTSVKDSPYPPLPLPPSIRVNHVKCPTVGLNFHTLEAGYSDDRTKPLLLLLHGYPELAFSWRKIMPSLASAGYYVVAPDQRGYGRTTGWDTSPFEQTDLHQFTLTNLVQDLVALVSALGYEKVHCVIGHDFGAVSGSMCALMRPDIFQSIITMSHPYNPLPPIPFNTAHITPSEDDGVSGGIVGTNIEKGLANLPEPRKHYKWANSTNTTAFEWDNPPQGLSEFLRGYVHVKSAAYAGNKPHPLKEWSAEELAKMPHYYIMPLSATMPEVVSKMMETEDASATKSWQPDEDLAVYVQEWSRTGFQGGLNWYRCQTNPKTSKDVLLFAGKKINVPAYYIGGVADWGNHQQPGAIEKMGTTCTQYRGKVMIEDAGHWPQQEQPERVFEAISAFLKTL